MDNSTDKRRILISLVGYWHTPSSSPEGGPSVDFVKHLNPNKVLIFYPNGGTRTNVFQSAAEFTKEKIQQVSKEFVQIDVSGYPNLDDEVAWRLYEDVLLKQTIYRYDENMEVWFDIYFGPGKVPLYFLDSLIRTGKDVNLIRYNCESMSGPSGPEIEEVRISAASRYRVQHIEKEKRAAEFINLLTYKEFQDKVPEFISNSTAMRRVADLICEDVFEDYNILIIGERGVGKEFVAKTIHKIHHESKDFHSYNCSTIPMELFESQLFGYNKGSFTGAVKDTKGLLEAWNGSVIFLDEIADMVKSSMLVKLNRLLQDGTFYRLGETKERKFDGIIIAATNKNVYDETVFPPDLLDRFDLIIEVPPLRMRKDDIEDLLDYFRRKYCNKRLLRFNNAVLNYLKESYTWPGNIRELEKWVKHIVRVYNLEKNKLSLKKLQNRLPRRPVSCRSFSIPDPGPDETFKQILDNIKAQAVKRALVLAEGDNKKAAEYYGVSYDTFRRYDRKMSS